MLLDAGSDPERRLGATLVWARQQQTDDLHVLVDDPKAAAMLARRAAAFTAAPTVWLVQGRELSEVAPAPLPTALVPPPEAELLRLMMVEAGLDVVVEQGNVLGELKGLEVARAVAGPDGTARLEVGIGRFDREAFAMMNPDLPDAEALARAVAVVAQHRRPDAPRHPLNQLVPERWLRSMAVAAPALVGAAELMPVESTVPRRNLRERMPATALGADLEGRPVVVACSTGVDLELVPTGADDRAWHAPDARLVLAVPERDILPVTTSLAGALDRPADVVAVPDDWRQLRPALS